MRINHAMSTSKTLTDLCVIRQDLRLKNTFANVAYNVLVVQIFSKNLKKLI